MDKENVVYIYNGLLLSHKKEWNSWEFPGGPWLGLSAFTAGAQVRSLVGGLRSHKLCGMAKQKQKQKQKNLTSREIESVITRKFSTKKSLGPYVITDDEKKNRILPFAMT